MIGRVNVGGASIISKNYFGTGAEGDFNSAGDAFLVSVLDGDPVILNYKNFTLNTGHIFTPLNRCKGMLIYVDGDCTINGTLTMTARGAKAVGQDANFMKLTTSIPKPPVKFFPNEKDGPGQYKVLIPKKGALGAPGVLASANEEGGVSYDGKNGTAGINGQCGGGGSGSVVAPNSSTAVSGNGSDGTSFSGGSGSGAARNYVGNPVPSVSEGAEQNGGKGGDAASVLDYGACGGAGNDGGLGKNANNGENGTGGLLILIVKGNLTIGASGKISSNGSNGGSGGGITGVSAGGGGSGGGSVIVLYGGNLTNNGTIQANGGLGGAAQEISVGGNGGNGGAGSIQIEKIYDNS